MTQVIKLMQYFCALLIVISSNVLAGVEQEQALNFGRLVVLSNQQVESFAIDRTGNINYSDVFRVIEPPERGRFRVFDLPSNTPFTISSVILQNRLTSTSPNVEFFDFVSLDHLNLVVTDELGEANIWVGGQISTSGQGSVNFGDLPLLANYRITIDF